MGNVLRAMHSLKAAFTAAFPLYTEEQREWAEWWLKALNDAEQKMRSAGWLRSDGDGN